MHVSGSSRKNKLEGTLMFLLMPPLSEGDVTKRDSQYLKNDQNSSITWFASLKSRFTS